MFIKKLPMFCVILIALAACQSAGISPKGKAATMIAQTVEAEPATSTPTSLPVATVTETVVEPTIIPPTADISTKGNTSEFPAPEDAVNFDSKTDGYLNYDTKMSKKDVINFYRTAFAKKHYQEFNLFPIMTIESGDVFSITFDGHASGNQIVIYAKDQDGMTRVDIMLLPSLFSSPTDAKGEYPMTSDATNITHSTVDSLNWLNYETKMNLKDVMEFYRDAYIKKGYTERPEKNIIEEKIITMAFDGHPSGKTVYITILSTENGVVKVAIMLMDL